jgi:regulator of protease activity HflC (stomatin/prohibitin superfamily)
VFINLGEQGLLERFGKPVEGRTVLEPGAHLKLPWPIDRVRRFRTEEIQHFSVGYAPDPKLETRNVVLWTVPHANEQNFLVANREPAPAGTNEPAGRGAPPVSLLTVSIPVQFQITNLLDWAYVNDDPTNVLQNLAEREVVRYLVSADLNEIMSGQQGDAAETLRQRIQAATVERKLGARIIFVGLQDIHPPVKVAPEYEKVVGAEQTRQAQILDAEADGVQTNTLAAATAAGVTNRASAAATAVRIGALAQAALFTNQIPAYQSAPSVYMERSYLQTFARATATARKYIVLTTNTQDVLQFDLQERIPNDFLGLKVTPERK